MVESVSILSILQWLPKPLGSTFEREDPPRMLSSSWRIPREALQWPYGVLCQGRVSPCRQHTACLVPTCCSGGCGPNVFHSPLPWAPPGPAGAGNCATGAAGPAPLPPLQPAFGSPKPLPVPQQEQVQPYGRTVLTLTSRQKKASFHVRAEKKDAP
jgi:hypothetical protein